MLMTSIQLMDITDGIWGANGSLWHLADFTHAAGYGHRCVPGRAISRLESRLGVLLLRRTTRRLSLTDSGSEYVRQARTAFQQIANAERALSGQGEVQGRVRLSAPTTYGHHR